MGVSRIKLKIPDGLCECETQLQLVIPLIRRKPVPNSRREMVPPQLKTPDNKRVTIQRISSFGEIPALPAQMGMSFKLVMGVRPLKGKLGLRIVGQHVKGAGQTKNKRQACCFH